MIKTILLSTLMAIAIVVVMQQQVNAYIPDAEREQRIKDYNNNVLWPMFEQKCKAELGIPETQILTDSDINNCPNATNDYLNAARAGLPPS
jgi:hypothetical protein